MTENTEMYDPAVHVAAMAIGYLAAVIEECGSVTAEDWNRSLRAAIRKGGSGATAVVEYCAHETLTGAEGPLDVLGRWPVLWSCDWCGATLQSETRATLHSCNARRF